MDTVGKGGLGMLIGKISLGSHQSINRIDDNFYSLLLLWLSNLNTKTKKKARSTQDKKSNSLMLLKYLIRQLLNSDVWLCKMICIYAKL